VAVGGAPVAAGVFAAASTGADNAARASKRKARGRLRRVWDDLPENVAWFVQQLSSSGFVETHREGGTMDSGLIVFRCEPVEVRLVKDHSQWSVDLLADGWRESDRLNFPLFHGFALD
jgi:hypothetical protein